MISIKTPSQINKISKAGEINRKALDKALEAIEVGISTLEIDKIVDDYIVKSGGKPGFKMVDGYDFATCINVNEGIVHGIPNDYELKAGDIVSIDLGTYLNGWHSDMAFTVEVGTSNHIEFLNVGKKALEDGISDFKVGNRLGDVSSSIQEMVENAGYTVSRDLVGHGIGKKLHEKPHVPGYGSRGEGIKIKEGMVFAIEVIYQKGNPEIRIADDGWTIATRDKSLAALFEHTVAVTENGPKVLTK